VRTRTNDENIEYGYGNDDVAENDYEPRGHDDSSFSGPRTHFGWHYRRDRAKRLRLHDRHSSDGKQRECWSKPGGFVGGKTRVTKTSLSSCRQSAESTARSDMLVNSGDWPTAEQMYANAKLSKEYPAWKYQAVLEDRIQHAQDNVALFNASSETSSTRIMISSAFACMACHQK
jgi:hypothetical protein